ncbi:hypothetical protein [Paenibacillus soyae]|uniref:Uncharacterized protein n=1 Tax=Paenibacillus soyae TaxID=2969249 RepID=A0A9X2S9U5_9BACL|nr:hypothetical protein [Paenibacillus soyae]MCR2805400.1 hypothetical protein [Paenibacillus soyae]
MAHEMKIGFYTRGNSIEREIQLSHLVAYAVIRKISPEEIVYYEDDPTDFRSLIFLIRYPIIKTLVLIDLNQNIRLNNEGSDLLSLINQLYKIEIIDLSKV